MRIRIGFLLSLFLLGGIAGAAEPEAFFPLDAVERGMRGYGLTVFEGTRIDTFQVEIIDVMRGRGGSGNVILARLSGLGIESSGVAQGMSGSPVYLNGRLAGAVAFAYTFAKEPIGGITPIEEMLEVLERASYGGQGEVPPPPADRSSSSSQGPEPIATPLLISGFGAPLAEEVGDFFRAYGMVPTAGGSGESSGARNDWKPLPGAAVGVRLLSGDANITAVGTITWVDDDRLLAFGHPFFLSGSVKLPLVSVDVHTLVPSLFVSFKLGSPVETVGALLEDRRPGVAGLLGASAPTVPIEVSVEVPGVERHEYRYEAVDEKRLTPLLVSWAVRNSILHRESAAGERTVRIRLFVDLEGAEDLERENIYSSGSVLGEMDDDILVPLQVLANNRLARPKVNSVRAEVTVRDGRRSARIERLDLEKGRVRPGEKVRGAVTLRLYQDETETRRFELDLPSDLPDGKLLLRACDAASSEEWDSKRSPNRFATKDINGVVRILEELRTNESVFLQLFSPGEGVTIDGREMPGLPGSRLAVLGAELHADDGDFVKGSVVASETMRLDAVVSGCRSLPVIVDRAAP
ncbi:MAG: SpoIVB peptidase S55 domain-containing protein [Candidatus Eisenbacteria bacterium]